MVELRPDPRVGAPSWSASLAASVRWELASFRLLLPVTAVVQVLVGVGLVIGVGFFFGHIPDRAALLVATGIPVVILVMVGVVVAPQAIAQQKTEGSYDFVRSLPVPVSARVLGWCLVALAISIPAVLVALAVAVLRFNLALDVSPAIVPAVLLVSFSGATIGLALGHAVRQPMVTQFATQVLILVVIGFSPIIFPSRQLPHWLAQVNLALPFASMADIVRAGLTTGLSIDVLRAYGVVAAWACASAVVCAWALTRRD
jgi:ABC-2 type transport system permease protein